MRVPVLCVVMLLAVASACASGGGSGPAEPSETAATPTSTGTGSQPNPPDSPASARGTRLTIVFDDGSGATSTWQLTCDPVGGNHPQPEAACAALQRSASTALPPVPKDRACTQIYGGPQKATITGTWQGRAVNSHFSRVNGCEIARWDALAGLLPDGKS